jgi:hypothetical protein
MRGKICGKDVHVEAELRCALEEAKDVFLFSFSAWDDGIEDNVQKSHALQHVAIDSCITNFLPTSIDSLVVFLIASSPISSCFVLL